MLGPARTADRRLVTETQVINRTLTDTVVVTQTETVVVTETVTVPHPP